MVFQRAHPECLAPSTWLAIRLALVQALSDCEGLLMQVHNAELDALQQRIARVRDRGLIEEPTQ
uniref:Uncharacterized protein n=1 Tax=Schlesneria paludicola TaxID=360056 RepID=A0A7C2K154_9PLAN